VYQHEIGGDHHCYGDGEEGDEGDQRVMPDAEIAYRNDFNRAVRLLFGAPNPNTTTATTTSVGNQSNKKRPMMEASLTAYSEWGKDLEFFLGVAKMAVAMLKSPISSVSGSDTTTTTTTSTSSNTNTNGNCNSSSGHFLSVAAMEKVLFSQDAPTMVERLVALPWLELHVFAAVCRLYALKNGVVMLSSTCSVLVLDFLFLSFRVYGASLIHLLLPACIL
jgi:hypothetical protein